MEFKNINISELNEKFGLDLKSGWECNGDFYEELNNQLENSKVKFYSTSFDEKDVLEDIEEVDNMNNNYEFMEVENVYIAIA